MKKRPLLVAAILGGIAITAPQVSAAENYAALFQPVARGDQSAHSVYFVMTDRFADGDPSNNVDGYDPTNIGYWHGGDFKGLS